MRIVGTLYRHMDKLIVGIALGPRYVTIYEIANQIHLAAQTVQSVAASALTPTTAYLRAQRDILRDMFLRGSSYVVGFAMPATVAGIIFAEPLIRAWVGALANEAAGPSRLFLHVPPVHDLPHCRPDDGRGARPHSFCALRGDREPARELRRFDRARRSLRRGGSDSRDDRCAGTRRPPLLWFFFREFGVRLGEWLRRSCARGVRTLGPGCDGWSALYLANRSESLSVVGFYADLDRLAAAAYYAVGLAREQRRS